MAVPKVLAVNYYTAEVDIAADASGSIIQETFFGPGHTGSSGTINDLPDGILPDNREGELTGVMVRHVPDDTIGNWTAANLQKVAVDVQTLRGCLFEVIINSVQVIRGPGWAFPHPPIWMQGAIGSTTVAAFSSENAGYMLYQINQEIGSRQSVKVRMDSQVAVKWNLAANVRVTLQVADRKAI